MDLHSNWDNEDRKSRLEIMNVRHNEKKEKKKEKRRILLREALDGLIHQIKVTILIITIVSLGILFLCATAWYILKIDEEKKSIISSTTLNSETIIFNYNIMT